MACANGERQAAVAPAARSVAPALRLVAITDLSGYLAPCGCQSRPLGGIDKAAWKLAQLRADGVPTLFVSAGDLLFGDRPEGSSDASESLMQETWRAETLLGALERLGLAAATPGARDLENGGPVFRKLAEQAHVRWLPRDTDPSGSAVASWVAPVGGLKIGVVGASSFSGAESDLEPARVTQLGAALQKQVDAVRAQQADVVVALLSTPARAGRRIVSGLRGVDFVVQGGVVDAAAPPPSRVGQSFVLRASRHGHGLLVVDLYPRRGAPFVDVSEWTRRSQIDAQQARVDELQARVSAWAKDPSVDPNDLAEQRKKLESLRAELGQLRARPAANGGGTFDARFEELGPEIKPEAQVTALLEAYDARVNAHNKVAFAAVLPKPAPLGTAHYVGAQACKSCHEAAYAWWQTHPHGNAYATLTKRHKEFNLSCVGCHVTGYGKPGGSTVVHNEGLVNVGCESCHGPGSVHVAHPERTGAQIITRDPTQETCRQCHTPEHSDLFAFAEFRKRLLVPGHGLPAPAPVGPKP
ncbi:MAG TPA: multiheme c-type cytochrome [Polyangiales bacterium]